jgi:hypothetical protein
MSCARHQIYQTLPPRCHMKRGCRRGTKRSPAEAGVPIDLNARRTGSMTRRLTRTGDAEAAGPAGR